MKVYFVRHAQSTFAEKKHQLPDTPLSAVGLKQAAVIARRFTHIPLDLILTSSYTRALQTAQAIQKIKSVELLQSDLLIERKMPSLFNGKSVDDPKITPIHQTIKEHFYESNWHYKDEENFADLISRAKAALEFIQSQQVETLAVVTHGYFLTIIIFYILFSEKTEPQLFTSFRQHTSNSNTGLTMCEYNNKTWKLITWNDYIHLGDV